MKIGIVGSGFGLYGYLPAVISAGYVPVTFGRYQEKIQNRADICQFVNEIEYVHDFYGLLNSSPDAIVLAVPFKIRRRLLSCFAKPFGGHLFLEKPLAISSSEYNSLIHELINLADSWSVGYLFSYTSWFQVMGQLISEPNEHPKFTVTWRLPRPESQDNWKINRAEGGGIVNYYLSHFIPFLRTYGFSYSRFSGGQPGSIIWEVGKRGVDGYDLKVDCGYGSHFFSVAASNTDHTLSSVHIFQSETPFGLAPSPSTIDPRSKFLCTYISETLSRPYETLSFQLGDYAAIQALEKGLSI